MHRKGRHHAHAAPVAFRDGLNLSTLNSQLVAEIRQAFAAGESRRSLAARFSQVTYSNICRLLRGETWAGIGESA